MRDLPGFVWDPETQRYYRVLNQSSNVVAPRAPPGPGRGVRRAPFPTMRTTLFLPLSLEILESFRIQNQHTCDSFDRAAIWRKSAPSLQARGSEGRKIGVSLPAPRQSPGHATGGFIAPLSPKNVPVATAGHSCGGALSSGWLLPSLPPLRGTSLPSSSPCARDRPQPKPDLQRQGCYRSSSLSREGDPFL